MRYLNKIGVIGWAANKLLKREAQSVKQFLFFDKYVLPISRFVDRMWMKGFGLSLWCVAVKDR